MSVGLYSCHPNLAHYKRVDTSVTPDVSPAAPAKFFDALHAETKLVAKTCHDRRVSAVYVGGTTLGVDDLDQLSDWLDQVRDLFVPSEPMELTIAVAPELCSRQLLEKLLTFGVTRIDLGIGSFERRSLRLLGRKQTAHQVHEAIYLANALGFRGFGCDLIYGLPGQTGKLLSHDLDRIIDLGPPHISLKRWNVGSKQNLDLTVDPPKSEFVDTFQRAAVESLSEHGYDRYAGDQFARPDHKCRYHIDRADGGDYIGLGPSAKSLIGGQRSRNVSSVSEYIDTLAKSLRPLVSE